MRILSHLSQMSRMSQMRILLSRMSRTREPSWLLAPRASSASSCQRVQAQASGATPLRPAPNPATWCVWHCRLSALARLRVDSAHRLRAARPAASSAPAPAAPLSAEDTNSNWLVHHPARLSACYPGGRRPLRAGPARAARRRRPQVHPHVKGGLVADLSPHAVAAFRAGGSRRRRRQRRVSCGGARDLNPAHSPAVQGATYAGRRNGNRRAGAGARRGRSCAVRRRAPGDRGV